MVSARALYFRAVSLIGLSVLVGCSGGPKLPDRAPVSGIVKLNDNPLTSVNVQFIPLDEAKGRAASGQTDANGKYVLSTFESNDGAMPGEYKVVVTRPTSDAEAFKEKKVEGGGSSGSEEDKIPEKYTNPKTTELKASVKSTKNEIPLDLK